MNWVRDWRLRKARRKLVVLGVMSGSTAPEYRHDRRKFAHGNIRFPWTFVPHDLSGADSAIAEAAKSPVVKAIAADLASQEAAKKKLA